MFFLKLVGNALSFYAAAYICCAIFVPNAFLRSWDIDRDQGRYHNGQKVVKYTTAVALMAGSTLLFAGAAGAILSTLPKDLGSFDEDGEWIGRNIMILLTIGFYCGVATLLQAKKVASVLAAYPLELAARSATNDALRIGEIENSLKEQIVASVEKRLLSNNFYHSQVEASEICAELRVILGIGRSPSQ